MFQKWACVKVRTFLLALPVRGGNQWICWSERLMFPGGVSGPEPKLWSNWSNPERRAAESEEATRRPIKAEKERRALRTSRCPPRPLCCRRRLRPLFFIAQEVTLTVNIAAPAWDHRVQLWPRSEVSARGSTETDHRTSAGGSFTFLLFNADIKT